MAAVILRPHSVTNHSDDFVVADFTEWTAFRYKARRDFTIHSRHGSLDEATEACQKINGKNEGDSTECTS